MSEVDFIDEGNVQMINSTQQEHQSKFSSFSSRILNKLGIKNTKIATVILGIIVLICFIISGFIIFKQTTQTKAPSLEMYKSIDQSIYTKNPIQPSKN